MRYLNCTLMAETIYNKAKAAFVLYSMTTYIHSFALVSHFHSIFLSSFL